MSTRYLYSRSDIERFAELLFSDRYAKAMNAVPDFDEVQVSSEAYALLRPHIKANNPLKDLQILGRAVMGVFNPLGVVLFALKEGLGTAAGDMIDPPASLTKGCRCIGSYYRYVLSDDGSTLTA